jgi:hypothetical protein
MYMTNAKAKKENPKSSIVEMTILRIPEHDSWVQIPLPDFSKD